MFQDSFKGVSGVFLRVFEACCKEVLKRFQGSFWRVSRKFPGVSGKFQECSKAVIEMYENFKDVSKTFRGILGKFQGCLREI